MKMTFNLNSFYKNNKLPLFLLLSGLLLFVISRIIQHTYIGIIPPLVSILNYASYLGILLSFFIFFVKKKRYILANLSLLMLLVLLLEIVCFCLLGFPYKEKKLFSVPFLPPEHIAMHIGTVPYGDSIYHDFKIQNADTIFNVHYSFDKNCTRITPDFDSTRTKYALFFGCSLAFGYGLNDNQTLPYFFQQISNQYNAYNYAYEGYGTNQMLARLEYQDLSKQVKGKDGIAFYIFFWDHIKRSIGTMDRYTKWLHTAPYYTFDSDSLVRKKMFKDGRYIISKIYELIYQSCIINYFKIDFPLKLKDRHFEIVSEIINKSKKTYSKQFGNDNFYVVFYPNYPQTTDEEFDRFKSFLDKKNLKYIDLSKFITYGPKYSLKGDAHPNANTNKMLAEEILKRITHFNNTDKK